MSRYDVDVDLANPNTSHAQMVELVGWNKRVLDVGCSTGYLAKVLADRGCTVSGVEYDAAAAEQARPVLDRLVLGDLESLDLVTELGEKQYDVVIYGDVLEHLRDPLPVLRQARPLLRPGGYVVASVPNVAHAAVRLALLRGRFEYRSLGLLDVTHLRFFTRLSLEELLRQSGLVPVEVRRTTAGFFETELGVKPDDYPADLVAELEHDPDARTYQFVLKAVLDDGDEAVWELHQREERLRERLLSLERELADTSRRLEGATAERNRLTDHVALLTQKVIDYADRAAHFEGELHEFQRSLAVRVARKLSSVRRHP